MKPFTQNIVDDNGIELIKKAEKLLSDIKSNKRLFSGIDNAYERIERKKLMSLLIATVEQLEVVYKYPLEKQEIKDFSEDGCDSVDSEDFPPGEGGRLPEKKYTPISPPKVDPAKLSDNDKLNDIMSKMSLSEIQEREDNYLRKYGVL